MSARADTGDPGAVRRRQLLLFSAIAAVTAGGPRCVARHGRRHGAGAAKRHRGGDRRAGTRPSRSGRGARRPGSAASRPGSARCSRRPGRSGPTTSCCSPGWRRTRADARGVIDRQACADRRAAAAVSSRPRAMRRPARRHRGGVFPGAGECAVRRAAVVRPLRSRSGRMIPTFGGIETRIREMRQEARTLRADNERLRARLEADAADARRHRPPGGADRRAAARPGAVRAAGRCAGRGAAAARVGRVFPGGGECAVRRAGAGGRSARAGPHDRDLRARGRAAILDTGRPLRSRTGGRCGGEAGVRVAAGGRPCRGRGAGRRRRLGRGKQPGRSPPGAVPHHRPRLDGGRGRHRAGRSTSTAAR